MEYNASSRRKVSAAPSGAGPTLPLKWKQTQGGYKQVLDAEKKLVAFMAMRDNDGEWADFLTGRVNSHATLKADLKIAKARADTFGDEVTRQGKTIAALYEAVESALLLLVNLPDRYREEEMLRAALALVDTQAASGSQ